MKSILSIILIFFACSCPGLPQSITICPGDINSAFIERNGKVLVFYGDPEEKLTRAAMIMFTGFRRDETWAGRKLMQNGTLAVVPDHEKVFFTRVDSVWKKRSAARFHDYYCQTTKIGIEPFENCRYVRGGETLDWEGIGIRILDTPGYTRGSVSYITDLDSKRYAFTGDLIYGDGKLTDLYSFQDSMLGIWGYHGYAMRLGQLVASLEKIAREKPDVIIPSRGPIITDPEASIRNLIQRVRALYRNYLSVSAYRWYFPERMKIMSDHVTGSYDSTDFMSYAKVIREDPPSWFSMVTKNSNSRLILSDDGSGFLVDCGMKEVFDRLVGLKRSGQLKSLDGILITHYHDDHTDYINAVVEEFNCPVYVTGVLKDILQNPGAYDLPCLTTDPIPNLVIMRDGQRIKWKDFTLTFYDFPGQTMYHDAMLCEKNSHEAIFFAGDSFTPSGIDDYCLLNRNLLHEKMGYFYCLDILKKLSANVLICNQHVKPLFAFSREQLEYMSNKLSERKVILKSMFTWDDPNYGLDAQWARIYPYAQKTNPGQTLTFSVKIFNHSGEPGTFIIKPNFPQGFIVEPGTVALKIDPIKEGEKTFLLKIPEKSNSGTFLITCDIKRGDWNLHEWMESIIEIK